jgi:RNA polymerase sigma-70 factor, ECF subfamily
VRVDGPEDPTLIQSAAAGDESSLAALYERYADVLFAFVCHRIAGERADAEDVFQETWLAALRSLASYRGQSAFFTWLCAIARNKIADAARRRRRHRTQSLDDLPESEIATLAEAGPLPDEILRREDVRLRVVRAMATLPDDYRIALTARYAGHCSVDEVARRLGKSLKATESVLSRARQALRDALVRAETEENHERER